MIRRKLKVIDLFSGCGGLSDGFEQTGKFETIAAVDWEREACNTLIQRLYTKWGIKDASRRVLCFDIQDTQALLSGWDSAVYGQSTGLDSLVHAQGGVDIIIGGPPCQAYSIAGRVRDANGMQYDYRNYLFESYLRVVAHYKPKIIVFENVPGILSACPGGVPIINRIQEAFNECGYEIISDLRRHALFDLSAFSVPQKRQRVIIVALQKSFSLSVPSLLNSFYSDLNLKWRSSIRTVKDAIGDLPPFVPASSVYKLSGKRYSHVFKSSLPNHVPRFHSARDISIFKALCEDIESGRFEYISIAALQRLYTARTGKVSNIHKYFVLRWGEPSNTIPAHLYKDGLRHIHPDSKQARSITVREAARLQSFDDEYIFSGSMTDQYKMVGNAVPPVFAKALGNTVAELFSHL